MINLKKCVFYHSLKVINVFILCFFLHDADGQHLKIFSNSEFFYRQRNFTKICTDYLGNSFLMAKAISCRSSCLCCVCVAVHLFFLEKYQIWHAFQKKRLISDCSQKKGLYITKRSKLPCIWGNFQFHRTLNMVDLPVL